MTRAATGPEPRRQAWSRGRTAERFAALLLRLKGYRILAQQYRTPVGEIDIVAKRSKCLVFVEIKVRKMNMPRAKQSVRSNKNASCTPQKSLFNIAPNSQISICSLMPYWFCRGAGQIIRRTHGAISCSSASLSPLK